MNCGKIKFFLDVTADTTVFCQRMVDRGSNIFLRYDKLELSGYFGREDEGKGLEILYVIYVIGNMFYVFYKLIFMLTGFF